MKSGGRDSHILVVCDKERNNVSLSNYNHADSRMCMSQIQVIGLEWPETFWSLILKIF